MWMRDLPRVGPSPPICVTINIMITKRSLTLLAATCFLMFGLTNLSNAANGSDYEVQLRASATFSGAAGHADYDVEASGRELDVEVRGLRRLAGRRVVVSVSGRRLGTMRVNSRGRAEREWKTSRGQRVPTVRSGTPLAVRTAGRKLILSGRFRLDD